MKNNINDKIDVLGVQFNNTTIEDAASLIVQSALNKKKTKVYTPNPEIVIEADKDARFMEVLDRAELVIADGIGVVIGSKILGTPLKARVAGYDTIIRVFEKAKHQDIKVFFLGAKPESVELARKNMMKKYIGLNVVGVHDGYFKDDRAVVDEINALSPDIVLVGLGAPKQEKFIDKYANEMNASVFIGCGGSFDVMAGLVKRAPKLFIKLHLEWFYRLIKQPSRFVRMLRLPLFLLKVLAIRIKGKKRYNVSN